MMDVAIIKYLIGSIYRCARFYVLVSCFLLTNFFPGYASPKDQVTIGMQVEPMGLDPTIGSNGALGDILLYNLYEGLTKINEDRSVSPLLAESWSVSEDFKIYTFKLRKDVRFHNGDVLTSRDVKFSFERARAPESTNVDKAFFSRIVDMRILDDDTIAIVLNEPYADFLFRLGFNSAVILNPKTVATNVSHPIGTGPFMFENWQKGFSLTLSKWSDYRDAPRIRIKRAVFRFIADAMAQIFQLSTGGIDVWPRTQAGKNLSYFQNNPDFQVFEGGTSGKTLLIMNHQRDVFKDLSVRQALAYAVDRHAIIEAATEGYGRPIGSHRVPGEIGYYDLTSVYKRDINKARNLLAAHQPFPRLRLRVPLLEYALRAGEVIQAQLQEVGIASTLEILDFPQWLSQVFHKRDYDLTIISHIEPLDLELYANPNYYFQYDSARFRELLEAANKETNTEKRLYWLVEAQKYLTQEVANIFLFQLPKITIARKNLMGLWRDSPIFVTDLSGVFWADS